MDLPGSIRRSLRTNDNALGTAIAKSSFSEAKIKYHIISVPFGGNPRFSKVPPENLWSPEARRVLESSRFVDLNLPVVPEYLTKRTCPIIELCLET